MKDLYAIIRKPVITERTTYLKEKYNKIIFEVDVRANKSDIKKAIERLFNVAVVKVNTTNINGKVKRFGRGFGKRSDRKKAIITLKKGDKIGLLEGI
ncbi:MAG: 50S ribosomal protein L23 [Nitrospinota bacterium]